MQLSSRRKRERKKKTEEKGEGGEKKEEERGGEERQTSDSRFFRLSSVNFTAASILACQLMMMTNTEKRTSEKLNN